MKFYSLWRTYVLSFLSIASSVFKTSLSMLCSSSGMYTALVSAHTVKQPSVLAITGWYTVLLQFYLNLESICIPWLITLTMRKQDTFSLTRQFLLRMERTIVNLLVAGQFSRFGSRSVNHLHGGMGSWLWRQWHPPLWLLQQQSTTFRLGSQYNTRLSFRFFSVFRHNIVSSLTFFNVLRCLKIDNTMVAGETKQKSSAVLQTRL